jgi:hypothetical protein
MSSRARKVLMKMIARMTRIGEKSIPRREVILRETGSDRHP